MFSNVSICFWMFRNVHQYCTIYVFQKVTQCSPMFPNVHNVPKVPNDSDDPQRCPMIVIHLQCSSIFLNVSQSFFFLTSLFLYLYPRLFRTLFFVFFFKSLPWHAQKLRITKWETFHNVTQSCHRFHEVPQNPQCFPMFPNVSQCSPNVYMRIWNLLIISHQI